MSDHGGFNETVFPFAALRNKIPGNNRTPYPLTSQTALWFQLPQQPPANHIFFIRAIKEAVIPVYFLLFSLSIKNLSIFTISIE